MLHCHSLAALSPICLVPCCLPTAGVCAISKPKMGVLKSFSKVSDDLKFMISLMSRVGKHPKR